MSLTQLAQDIYICDGSFHFGKENLGLRMTVVKLPEGQLWVHSPIPLTDSLAAELETLGQVAYVVAPNKFHHLYLTPFLKRFPNAKLWLAPGLAKKRTKLEYEAELEQGAAYPWSHVIDHHRIQGANMLGEVVFYHRPSQTLLVTDIFFNVGPAKTLLGKLFYKINRAGKGLVQTRMLRFTVKDKDAFRDSMSAILEWDFKRIVVTHGSVIYENAKSKFDDAIAWLAR